MDDVFWNEEVARLSRGGDRLDDPIQGIQAGPFPLRVAGLSGSASAFFIQEAWRKIKRPLVVVCASSKEAEDLFQDIAFFSQLEEKENPYFRSSPILLFPAYESLSFREYFPQPEVAGQRLACLYALLTRPGPALLVTSLPALQAPLIPRKVLSENVDYLARAEETDREALAAALRRWGYFDTPLVEEPGDLSIRGGILDLYPPLYPRPIRLEFFGDLAESIREFNPASQRSFQDLEEVYLLPISEVIWDPDRLQLAWQRMEQAHEARLLDDKEYSWLKHRLDQGEPFEGSERWLDWFYERPGSLQDYLPSEPLIIWKDPLSLQRLVESKDQISFEMVLKQWAGFDQLSLEDLPLTVPELEQARLWTVSGSENQEVRRLLQQQTSSKESLRDLTELLKGWAEWEQEVWLVVSQDSQARRLRDILAFYQIEAVYQPERKARFGRGGPSLQIIAGTLKNGFRLTDPALIFLTEEEIFGSRKEPTKAAKEDLEAFASSLDDLKMGDLVVHREHGIGRFQGLRFLRSDTWEGEFLFLEYGENDKLYLPVDRIQGIHKFQGLDEQVPLLDRLGGNTWKKAKDKARKAVEKIARELVELYARRALVKGFSFSPRDQLFKEFEAGFPYEETPDQLRAIEEVLADMESENPMDRLVCGDVGYGKTEVALRAAFRAVLDGKQVAFLVPTTVLAEQHYQTMRQRFQVYPVEFRALSRFKTPKEQKKILEDLAGGKVDVVVGTHRLLQKDVRFRDLGLMIIDEEHRFGVSHKERLKTLKTQVDCLTLTATPIPRTLQFSLAGIRDLSTIETPPENRQSIRTFIARFEEDKIAEAVRQEMQRGGQVFFVHNRVHNIGAMAHFLKKILPGVRLGIAHGQLPERELEKVMLRFIHRELDLLLCTTIIESGLDIPTANTIIINQADHFGLAQMYQLRGRVGRARERAYAYLLISGDSTLTREAQKRLKVLMDFSELGAGFKIALHDLQIRGAGTLLGTRQSGHIAAVGYEMYLQLLEEAIREMKGEAPVEEWEPEIRLGIPAYLPESYIAESGQRLSLYKRLSSLADEEALDRMKAEMEDRFGRLPEAAGSLLQVLGAKLKMKKLGIEKMELTGKELFFSLHPAGGWSPEKLVAAVQKKKGWLRFQGEGKLVLHLPSDVAPLETLHTVLNQLSSLMH